MASKKIYLLAVNWQRVTDARKTGGEVWRHVLAFEKSWGDDLAGLVPGDGWRLYAYDTKKRRDAVIDQILNHKDV